MFFRQFEQGKSVPGLANYLGTPYIGLTAAGFSALAVPGLSGIPVLGRVLFSQDALVYLSFVLPALFWLFWRFCFN